MSLRRSRSLLAAAVAAILAGCFSAPPRVAPPPARPPPPPTSLLNVPDAVPRFEPRSILGNPPFYDVFGKRYYVMASSVNYVERGVASWYGPGFHKERTSMGEPYDMYGMTAAHKTLPLPAYVRVTNLENGRSVVVRVNDRGPFVGNRIIDLSYTAAAKLDMLRDGTAMVEVRALQPIDPAGDTHRLTLAALGAVPPGGPAAAPAPAPAPASPSAPAAGSALLAGAPLASPAPPAAAPGALAIAPAPVTSAPVRGLYVQAGAFADPANAERLVQKLRGGGYGHVFVRDDVVAGRRLYRVRIGPVPGVPEFDRIVTALEQVGVRDAHLALD
ncbi:MAG TPA: septal ring lytic transglycosylase RlpA family protein [Steroidobacteraceae bacterium]|nr:septal ring lytic transglycosylase RlpA family protein [Steroidobacteraceae bacterium]